MAIRFDPAKDAANIRKHGVSLAEADQVDVRAVERDDRQDYGERRFLAFGLLDGLPHCYAFTVRGGDIRVISLRRCRWKEFRRHVPE